MFALQVLLARLMELGAYGHYVTLWTWLIMLGSFGALGFSESSVRFLPRYRARGREQHVVAYWRFGLWAVVIGSSLIAGAAGALSLWLGDSGAPGVIAFYVALGLPFLAIEYYLGGVCRSFGWVRMSTVAVYVVRPILIGAAVLALSCAGVAITLPVIGFVIVAVLAAVSLMLVGIISWRLKSGRVKFRLRRASPRETLWLKASAPMLLVAGLEDILTYSDVLILSALMSPEDVSVYFAAARTLALANFVYFAMYTVSGRGFALALEDTDRSRLQETVLETTRITVWSTIVALAVTLLAAPVFLLAFGPEFVGGFWIMLVLACGLLGRALAGQAAEVLVVTGRQKENIWLNAGVLAVSLLLTVSLVPIFGVYGAALGNALALTLRSAAVIVIVRRALGLRVVSLAPPNFRRTRANPA
jgi:O-antigen/teichoic acid export membrane protein